MRNVELTGIVLAGGKSSRMGRDKALMEFRGRPLIQHAVDILKQVCHQVVISSNKKVHHIAGCEIWQDELAVQAPMVGIYSCLKRSSHAWNIILSCDMPLVDPKLFDFLLSHDLTKDVIVPVHDEVRIEPLCGLYNRSAVPLLERSIQSEHYSLMEFIRAANHELVEIGPGMEGYRKEMFTNLNAADDFDLLSTP